MTLTVFNINGKTPQEKERLKRSVNWDETLINNLRMLVGILFGPIAFEGLRDIIILLTSVSSAGLRKKEFVLIGGRKSRKLFLEYLIENWMPVATFIKYLLKELTVSCGSVKLWPLSKILDGAILDNSFKEISFFMSFRVLFKSFKVILEITCKIGSFIFFH